MASYVPLLKSLTLTDFLSFGPGAHTILLTNLNIVIGPNASGKSNFVEAFAVLRAVPRDLPLPIRRGGGVNDWLWSGPPRSPSAVIEAIFRGSRIVSANGGVAPPDIRYRLEFESVGDSFGVRDERIENEQCAPGARKPYFYFGYERGRPVLNVREGQNVGAVRRHLQREDIDPTQSILSQRRDPEAYPELFGIADRLGRIAAYRSWTFGPDSALRASCGTDLRSDILLESFDNLPIRLATLKKSPGVKRRLIKHLNDLAPGFDDLEITPEGGQLHLYLIEGTRQISARRLSDGTLRYLCLLAILLDEQPPPLVVIEEPELGLHPDVLPTLRDLLIDASSRCQLVVTTHSPSFIDAFTDHADCVLVCEKPESTTTMTRLQQTDIDRIRVGRGLGDLWLSGELGGTRW